MGNFRTDQIQDERGNKWAIVVQMRPIVMASPTNTFTRTDRHLNIKLEPAKYMLSAIHLNVEIEMCIDDVDKNRLHTICTRGGDAAAHVKDRTAFVN